MGTRPRSTGHPASRSGATAQLHSPGHRRGPHGRPDWRGAELYGRRGESRAVAVGADATRSRFDITCRPRTGTIVISTTTTGPRPDPDGYAASVDGGGGQAIASNGTLSLPESAGRRPYHSALGFAPNCSLAGDNPRSATVTKGGTTMSRVFCQLLPRRDRDHPVRERPDRASHLYRARKTARTSST